VERWERERILGEWGVRDGGVRDRNERALLEEDLQGHPGKGRALRRRLRNFRPDVDRYVASLGGPLPYMQRLRAIDEQMRAHEERLAQAWLELDAECRGDDGAFVRRWATVAARWNFAEVNALIERHNRYFPAEARLPMDPKTGDFVLVAGEPYRKRPLDAAWVLERFRSERRVEAAHGG
jgi:hypothetical protein